MTAAARLVTVEEYLAAEKLATEKHEYLNGVIYAMSGGSPNHGQICVNLAREVSLALKEKPCNTFSSDTKVSTSPSGLFSYPDLTIVCSEAQFFDPERYVLTNPTVLFEVLSPTTEGYDRGEKFRRYREIQSLSDYVLVSQEQPSVEIYSRRGDTWQLSEAYGLGSAITIPSLGIALSLAEVYEKVEFPAPQSEAEA